MLISGHAVLTAEYPFPFAGACVELGSAFANWRLIDAVTPSVIVPVLVYFALTLTAH